MNNLSSLISALFLENSPDMMFSLGNENFSQRKLSNRSPKLNTQVSRFFSGASADEVANVCEKAECEWGSENGEYSVFRLIEYFSKQVLRIKQNTPFVEYSNLLRWRELSHQLGEDLFTCSYLASQDTICSHHRSFFAWRPILTTNNIRLKNILEQGVAENHFHLQGSAPHNELSWIALMNKVTGRKKQFEEFLKTGKLSPSFHHHEGITETSLYVLTLKAAYIRLYLFYQISQLEENGFFSHRNSNAFLFEGGSSDKELIAKLPELQRKINAARRLYGKVIDPDIKVSQPDYCLTKDLDERNLNGNEMLCGERMFLYQCFRLINLGEATFKPFQDLFYIYLVIKSKFREEMIQVNEQVGFHNFSLYQDRKDVFLQDRDIYQAHIYKMAIGSSVENQTIQSFEARVSPKDTKERTKAKIEEIDFYTKEKKKTSVERYLEKLESKEKEVPPFFYVHHFIKKGDNKKTSEKGTKGIIGHMQCRHHKLRKEIAQQAKAIAQLRDGTSAINQRMAGIDAAASELDTRPEVFGQVFRYLKNYRNKGTYDRLVENPVSELKATFHAGEDFYDIVDGMRAIDEAIKFLNLSEGDRIGHALALGVEPREYYQSKGNVLMLPKQWHLDNISWLISRISKYNLFQFSTYRDYLGWQFQTLYHEIYDSFETNEENNSSITPELYYEAWKLRGDDPFFYNPNGVFEEAQHITFWSKSGLNHRYPVEGAKRKSKLVNKLYYHYHFNPEVKKRGAEIYEFKVPLDYIKVVQEIQKCFQREIAQKHLGIETNPSSNCLIGTFRRYDKHPLLRFFNLGLEIDPDKIRECPQLFVSINTDDQGVFNTYLENEYALMALALEKMKDENGQPIYHSAMIYDWLDRIRKMGLEMSFKK